MKTFKILLGILLLCALPLALFLSTERGSIGSAQDEARPAGANVRFTLEQLRADFEQLRNAMERHHPALYAHTPKKEFDGLFDSLYAALEPSMDLEDSFRVFSSLMARIGCGHSSVSNSGANPSRRRSNR